jgi:hypothetical protein
MNSCACPPATLTSVAFAHGIVMQRCVSHEQQTWILDGRPIDSATVRPALKDLFIQQRDLRQRPRSAAPRRHAVPLVPTPTPVVQHPAADPRADDLTALLNARGLQGSWSVA